MFMYVQHEQEQQKLYRVAWRVRIKWVFKLKGVIVAESGVYTHEPWARQELAVNKQRRADT
jgi:hypothetical protein